MSDLNSERQAGLTRRRFISESSKALAVGAFGTGATKVKKSRIGTLCFKEQGVALYRTSH